MNSFPKLLLSASFVLAIIGCGGGGDSNNNDNTGSFADIAGLWDLTSTEANGATDVFYMQINADGSGVFWDYFGDSFDNGADCYKRGDFSLTKQADNSIQFSDGDNWTSASVVNGQLQIQSPGNSVETIPAVDASVNPSTSAICP